MTGPEHYQAAEQWANTAEAAYGQGGFDVDALLLASTVAQVHATLALAAATAEPIAQGYDGDYDKTIPEAWSEAIS